MKKDIRELNGVNSEHHCKQSLLFGYSVKRLSDLPTKANEGEMTFVEETLSLYVFNNGKWYEYCAGRVYGEEETKLRSEQMKIQEHCDNYGKKEPEVIGDREYIVTEKPPVYENVPKVFGIFGVEMVIGQKVNWVNPKFIAREYESDENRIRVNISNFIFFVKEKFSTTLEIDTCEYEDTLHPIWIYNDFTLYFSKTEMAVKQKKGIFKSEEIVEAIWEKNWNTDISDIRIDSYRMEDKHIADMKNLVEHMQEAIEYHNREEARKKDEEDADKQAKKIYYDMLGI